MSVEISDSSLPIKHSTHLARGDHPVSGQMISVEVQEILKVGTRLTKPMRMSLVDCQVFKIDWLKVTIPAIISELLQGPSFTSKAVAVNFHKRFKRFPGNSRHMSDDILLLLRPVPRKSLGRLT